MLLPFQGANPNIHRPRALPWAGCLLAFQAVTSQKLYRTPIKRNTYFYILTQTLLLCAETQRFMFHTEYTEYTETCYAMGVLQAPSLMQYLQHEKIKHLFFCSSVKSQRVGKKKKEKDSPRNLSPFSM